MSATHRLIARLAAVRLVAAFIGVHGGRFRLPGGGTSQMVAVMRISENTSSQLPSMSWKCQNRLYGW